MSQLINILITAGCPGSGWETVVPILERAGLNLADSTVAGWLDEIFEGAPEFGAVPSRQPLRPDSRMGERAAGLLADAGGASLMLADGRNLWLLDFWAATIPEARFVLLYRRADMALAGALPRGVDPRAFLEEWQTASRQLLQFQRRNRKRALLLDVDAAARRPDAFIQATRRCGIALNDVGDGSAAAAEPFAIERLVAANFTSNDPAIAALHAELDASAQPLGDAAPPPGGQELLEAYRRWQLLERTQHERIEAAIQFRHQQAEQISRLQQDLDRARAELQTPQEPMRQAMEAAESAKQSLAEENELLLLQLGQLQKDLERAQEHEAVLVAANQEHVALAGQLRQDIEAAESAKQSLAEENELLLLQLGQLHQDLDRAQGHEVALAAANQENAGLAASLQQAQAELEASRWRLHESELAGHEREALQLQLRADLDQAQRATLAAEAARGELAQENELLMMQLVQLQEEVEHYSAKYHESLGALQDRDREIGELGRRVAGIQKNIFWRATAPLRSFAAVFSRGRDEKKAALKREAKLIERSALFDREWYLAKYADVRRAGVDPVRHYLCYGAAEGRNPSPEFDGRFYLETYPEVAESGMNPLVHFIKFGRSEGRKPSPGSPVA